MQIVYKGFGAERKKQLTEAMVSGIAYPSYRAPGGRDLNLLEDEAKDPVRVKFVTTSREDYKAKMKKEIIEAVEVMDASKTVQKLVFKKGVPVEVSELTPKLAALVEAGELSVVEPKEAKAKEAKA